jgi:ATP-binding cassette subfamily C protein CydD
MQDADREFFSYQYSSPSRSIPPTLGIVAASTSNGHRWLLRLVPAVRGWLVAAIAAGLAAASLLIVQVLLLSEIVRAVLFHHETLAAIAPSLVLTACAMVGRAVLLTLREVTARRAAIYVKAELRKQLAEHLLRLGPAYVSGERTGDLVATATEGIELLDAYVSRYLPQLVLGSTVPLLIVLAILPVDPLTAGLLIFTVPIIILLMILIGMFTRDRVQQQWEALGQLSSAFLDVIQGLPTLLLLDRYNKERHRVEAISEQFRDRTLSVLKVAFVSGAVLEFMTAAAIGLIATVLGVRLLDGGIPFDRAFFVFLLTPEFYRPLRDLGTHRHAMIEGTAAAERIQKILQTPALAPSSVNEGTPVTPVNGPCVAPRRPLSVELEDVTYVYPEREQPALEHVTLTLPAGTCTAVVGKSGSGKTTLVNLLLRAMDPTSGVIRVNGIPLRAIPVDIWREQIALVPQRPYLFHGTVRDNIRLARPQAGTEEVVRAAELAGCLSFIAALTEGFDTVIGERGEGLSAGQRQRLAIARAFLKDAPLLVLDEPTSALDPESEAQIRRALALLMRDRTVLVVAHRLNTVKAADQVAVLDGGRLVEFGTHHELLQRGGTYAALTSSQRVEVPA